MKKTFKHFLALIFLVMICFSQQVNAQLSDAEKQERCQNNKNRLAELETQLRVITAELSKTWSKKEIENARDNMIIVKELKAYFYNLDREKLRRIEAQYNYKDCYELISNVGNEHAYIECLTELEKLIAKKIDKALPLQNKRPELINKKNEIDKQIANHRTNIIALGCDSKELTENSGLNVSATWDFECCGGAYKGKLTLIQDGDKISGYFGETTNGTTGEISGRISGTSLTFERRWDGKKQNYYLTVSANGKTLTGNFSGDRNTSVGTDVIATRK